MAPTYRSSSAFFTGAVTNSVVLTHTPTQVGSTLVVTLIRRDPNLQDDPTSVTSSPEVNVSRVFAGPRRTSGFGGNWISECFIAATGVGSLVEHTITINYAVNVLPHYARVWEWSPCSFVSADSDMQQLFAAEYDHAATGVSGTGVSGALSITGWQNCDWSDMDAAFTRLAVDRTRTSHYREDYSPASDTGPISRTLNVERDCGGIYVLLQDGAAPPGPTQNTPTPDQNGVFGSIGSYDASGDWTTSGGPLTFGNVQNGPVGLTITPSGILQWTNNMVLGTYAGVTYDCTDDNGTKTSNTFTFTQSAAPPSEDTPPPSPTIAAGFTGTVADVSANYSPGAGGTGPIKFYASNSGTAWPGWLSINETTGVITATSAVSTVAGLQIRVEDSTTDPGPAVNDTGTPFQITVSGAGGTLTTPPLKDHTGTLLTGQTGYSVKAVDATATGTPVVVYAAANIAQEANGTIEITDNAFTIGDWYYLDGSIPDADPATNKNVTMYRFNFLLQAT